MTTLTEPQTETSRLISFMEKKNITELGFSLERTGRDLELYEWGEGLPELTDEETNDFENLILGWLDELNYRRQWEQLNGGVFLEDGELSFSGEGKEWTEVFF